MKIIVVEDNELLAKEMSKDVILRGHECRVIETIEEYAKINSLDYDFAVVDLSLPDSFPLQTLEAVQKVGLPAVLMTVAPDEEILNRAGEAGYVVHTKSSNMMSIYAILANAIGLAKRDKERNRKLQLAYEQLEKITTEAPSTLTNGMENT